MIDIVMPKGNESEFIEMAKKLGYSALCFVYNDTKQIPKSDLDIIPGVLVKDRKRSKKALVLRQSTYSREAVEAGPDIVFGVEDSNSADYIHQRKSGLNHVICRLANEKKVAIGFMFSHLLDKHMRIRILGRMAQNIKLCRKFKVRTVIASMADDPYNMRSPKDILSLFIDQGFHPKEARDALTAAEEIFKTKQH